METGKNQAEKCMGIVEKACLGMVMAIVLVLLLLPTIFYHLPVDTKSKVSVNLSMQIRSDIT